MKYQTTLFPLLITAMLAALCLGAISPVYGQDKTNEQNQQQTDIIKLNTSLVTLPVMVSDPYGRFVTGLTRQDFQVHEDGVIQQIASFSSTEAPFNVALLIDTSRSTRNRLGAIRKAALEFIKQLQPRDRVLIVTFDERVNFLGDFTSDRQELTRAIRSVKSNYLTSLYDAIHITITEKLATVAGRKAIVALTDGVDTFSRKATFESSLDLVVNTGVICYAVQYETQRRRAADQPHYPTSTFFQFLYANLLNALARSCDASERSLSDSPKLSQRSHCAIGCAAFSC